VTDSELGLDEADVMLGDRKDDLERDPSLFFSLYQARDNDAIFHFQNLETRFFTVEKGYIDVGAPQIEIRQKVCVLFGNKFPIVLRPVGNQLFKVFMGTRFNPCRAAPRFLMTLIMSKIFPARAAAANRNILINLVA
jgi:hypothetical protein